MLKSMAVSGAGTTELERNIILEQSIAGSYSAAVEEIYIPASDQDTKVVVTAEVANSSGRASEHYTAIVRRRFAEKLAKNISELGQHAEKEDFEVYVFPTHKSIVELLNKLGAASLEGNSREILRMIRDSIGDGRWDRLRDETSRNVFIECIYHLRDNEFVEPSHVKLCRSTLRAKSLLIVPAMDLSAFFQD